MIDLPKWQELEDLKLRATLVQRRLEVDMTAEDVAGVTGCLIDDVENLEDLSSGPYLSTMRRYAAAVGAIVTHNVHPFTMAESTDDDDSVGKK